MLLCPRVSTVLLCRDVASAVLFGGTLQSAPAARSSVRCLVVQCGPADRSLSAVRVRAADTPYQHCLHCVQHGSYRRIGQHLITPHFLTGCVSSMSYRRAPCVCVSVVGARSGWHGVLAAFLYPLSSVELTPNIGLQWYFFTQTFDRFRTFFHLVLAALPITLSAALCLTPSLGGSQPHIAAVLVSCVVQLLHPQPVLGGLAVCGCVLLSVGWLCGGRLRPLYVQVCVALFSLLMLQLMWFMWLSPGSGNANFFYFQTLLFGFAFAALIVELTSAARRQRGDSLDEPSMK